MKTSALLPDGRETTHGRRPRTRRNVPRMPTKKPAAASKKTSAAPTKSAPAVKKKALPEPAIGTLAEGDVAPDFALEGDDGKMHSLSQYRGKNVVVYFYPRDETPGCTVEAQEFRAAKQQLTRRSAIVLGVSRDSIASHCRFRDKHSLNFTLLSDPDAKVIARWGAWGEKNMYGNKSMGIVRTTVVVGPDGRVRRVFPKVKVAGHVEAVIASL